MMRHGTGLALSVLLVVTATAHAGCGSALGQSEKGLRTAALGGECGAGIAVCPASQCCSQYGRCEARCVNTCQCAFSGKESSCNGTMIFTEVGVPEAPPAGVCGPGVATCPMGQCCNQYGFCGSSKADCARGCDRFASTPDSACKTTTGDIVRYNLSFDWKELAPDGFTRPTITVNGQFPAPTIRCKQGDRLIIRVKNNLNVTDPVSIHWHGILQRGSVIMDGVAGVTQRAIPEGASQLYNFICDLPGTYWYHSHFKAQYIDGLKGALIVEEVAPAVKPVVDSIIQLSDWYHESSEELNKVYLSPTSGGDEPVPMSALINGVGQGNCTGSKCRYLAFPAVPGTCQQGRTRLRIINTSGFAVFTIEIDGHSMVVTSVDALPIMPSVPVKAIQINAGQRYDVSVCADNATFVGKPAWIRAKMEQEVFPSPAPEPWVLAVLQYAPPGTPVKQLPTTKPSRKDEDDLLAGDTPGATNPYTFRPLSGATPPPATRTLRFTIDMFGEPTRMGTNYAHFNNISMQLPQAGGPLAPTLLERSISDTLPRDSNFGYHTVDIKEGEVIDIVINNHDGGEHPLHLHGHWYWVMARGADDAGDFDPKKVPLDKTPILRDTVTVNSNSYVVMRFVASNPGAWIFHCHIDWHLEAGLAMVFRYGMK